jgi:hypothetical protein
MSYATGHNSLMSQYLLKIYIYCRFCRLYMTESELLYDWQFNANQFILVISPLKLTTSNFF